MDYIKQIMAQEDIANAEFGYTQALMDPETPEKAAVRLRKARMFDLTPEQTPSLTPEEEATARAKAVNWAAMYTEAPTLMERMSQPAFANLVKNDLSSMTEMEKLLWKLSPNTGEKDSVWDAVRNAFSRGGYTGQATWLGGSMGATEAYTKELDRINQIEKEIEEGKDVSHYFVTPEDETGQVGLAGFLADKERIKANLTKGIEAESAATARRVRYAANFPESQALREMMETESFGDAMSAFAESPMTILADLGVSSLAQQAPSLLALPILGVGGVPAQMAGTFGMSAASDKYSQMMQYLSDEGIDLTNPESIASAYKDPTKREMLSNAIKRAENHAVATAALDAASIGVASKFLVPKSAMRQVLDSAYKKEFANMAIQMPVQGAMGAAGEALGQYMADGEISSWADVVAEFVGEHFTAPVEVFTTGLKARTQVYRDKQKALANADTLSRLKDLQTMAGELDPQSVADFQADVARRAKAEKVTFDAQSFHQLGLDTTFSAIPEVAQKMPEALATGGTFDVPMETFLNVMLPKDKSGQLLEIASVGGTESVADITETESAIENHEAKVEKLEEIEANRAFNAEVADVGRAVGKDLRALGITKEEARNIQAIVQLNVANMARQAGVSPKEVWAKYGARYLGEPNIIKTPTGVKVDGTVLAEDSYEQPLPVFDGGINEYFNDSKADGTRYLKRNIVVSQGLSEFINRLWGFPANSFDMQISNGRNTHAGKHELSAEDLAALDELPANATEAIQTLRTNSRGAKRLILSKETEGGNKLVGIYEVSHSPRRVEKGTGADVKLNLVTAYRTTTEKQYQVLLRKEEVEGETSVSGRRQTLPLPGGHNIASPETSVSRVVQASQASDKDGSFSQDTKGDYFPSLRVIARWKNADASTLIHETGHMFLDMRMRLATDMIASGQQLNEQQQAYVDSVADVLTWFGIKDLATWNAMDTKAQEPYHEKFARSFEAYMMEGKAPTNKLEKVFRDFAKWLKDVYTVMANIPDAQLSDDVREMFDAMFVSQDEVREAQARQAAQPLFMDFESSGMSAIEWKEYQEAQDGVITKAESELRARNIRMQKGVKNRRNKLLRALRTERKGIIADIRDQVEKEYKATRVYKLWDTLVNGYDVEGEHQRLKLFFEDLKMLEYTDGQIKKLHKARLASPQAHLQKFRLYDIALEFGYANPNEMVDELLANLDPKAVIEQKTLERLMKEQPDFANESTMRDLADASTFNESKSDVVSKELAVMERTFNVRTRTEAKAIDKIAYAAVQAMEVGTLKPVKFVRAANRAARNARKAWAKGAMREAITFKRQELYQTALAKHARESLIYFSKETKGFKKFKDTSHRAMDTKLLTVIQRCLANMGFYTESQLHLNKADKPFSLEVSEIEAELGYGLDISPAVLKAVTEHDASLLTTVEGMETFIRAIKTLEAQARREKAINTIEGRKELEKTQLEAAIAVRDVAEAKGRNFKKEMEENGKKAQCRDLLEKFGFNHARAAALVAVLDGSWTGVLSKLLIYPSDKCGNTEETLKAKYAKKLHDILSPLDKSLLDLTARTSKVFNHAFTTQQVFVLLLNYGNEGNRQRALSTVEYLTDINFFGDVDPKDEMAMARAQARADQMMRSLFAEYLTDEHYTAAEQIWAMFDEVKETTGKVQREIVGREPEWVEATPIQVITPNGMRTLSGGYYPIAYDRKASLTGKNIAETDTLKSMQPIFAKSGVSDGWTKSRVKFFDHALVLTSRAMFEGLDEQIHYVSWAAFLNNARKLLNPTSVLAITIKERYGTEYYNTLQEWLEDCRNGNRGQMGTADEIANVLRQNVSLAGIGLNFGTAALQLIGITQSIAYLGGEWAGKGISEFLKMGPTGSFKAVAAKSEMMQNRMRTQFRELTEIQTRLNGSTSDLKDKFMRAAYMPLTVMQMAVDLPTWLGAYQKAVYEGKSEALAVAEADRAVMNSQGSGRLQDLSKLERSGAWTKLFTVFYTFFNTALNLMAVSRRNDRGMKRATTILMIAVMQPVIESFVKSAVGALVGDADDDWLEKAMKDAGTNFVGFNLGLFVGFRELSYLTGDFGYQGPAGLRKITDTGRAINAWLTAADNGEISESTVKATVSAMGVWVGLPVTPINRAISGGNALYEGETDNPAALFLGYSKRD